jgi:NitT/TauT family transport system substrate-binding protein
VTYVATTPQALPALISGEVSILYGASSDVVAAALNGADVVFVSTALNKLIFSLYTKPQIKSVQDLRGTRLGISRVGSGTDFSLRWYLQQERLQAGTDVNVLSIGEVPAIFAALQGGSVDGGVLSPPFTIQAKQAGYSELANFGKVGPDYVLTGIVTSRKFLKDNPRVVEQVVKGIINAIKKDKADPSFAKQSLAKWAKVPDPTVQDATWDAYAEFFQDRPALTDQAFQSALDQLVQAGETKAKNARPSDFYDVSVLNAISSSAS